MWLLIHAVIKVDHVSKRGPGSAPTSELITLPLKTKFLIRIIQLHFIFTYALFNPLNLTYGYFNWRIWMELNQLLLSMTSMYHKNTWSCCNFVMAVYQFIFMPVVHLPMLFHSTGNCSIPATLTVYVQHALHYENRLRWKLRDLPQRSNAWRTT